MPVVAVDGEIDLAVAPALRQRLDRLIAEGVDTVVVDLSEATFIDSVGLGVLVNALDRCRQEGGELYLVVTEPRIMKVLEITGLVKVFPLFASLDELNGPREGSDA
jgi:anti-sigma B factor antagonist